jgi:hypothetical protein
MQLTRAEGAGDTTEKAKSTVGFDKYVAETRPGLSCRRIGVRLTCDIEQERAVPPQTRPSLHAAERSALTRADLIGN